VLQTLLVALLVGFALQAMGRRRADPARHRAHPAAGLQDPRDDHVGGARSARSARSRRWSARPAWTRSRASRRSCSASTSPAALRLRRPRHAAAGRRRDQHLQLLRYLGREFLLILSTSSSESALPRLIAKMEHLGVSKPVVGITVPTGYSFNLDGTRST
jgi:aerobic C4-dicarboxylate transport protein